MKRFMIAIALTCILSVSAFAGEIPMTLTGTTTPTPISIPVHPANGSDEDDDSLLPPAHLTVILTILGIVV